MTEFKDYKVFIELETSAIEDEELEIYQFIHRLLEEKNMHLKRISVVELDKCLTVSIGG